MGACTLAKEKAEEGKDQQGSSVWQDPHDAGKDEGLEAHRTAYIKHSISWKPFNWSVLLNAIMDSPTFSHKQNHLNCQRSLVF